MSNLHKNIMNLPCNPSLSPVSGVDAELAYKYGHRDARHAAAELVAREPAPQPEQSGPDPYAVAEKVRKALDRNACPNVFLVIAYEEVIAALSSPDRK